MAVRQSTLFTSPMPAGAVMPRGQAALGTLTREQLRQLQHLHADYATQLTDALQAMLAQPTVMLAALRETTPETHFSEHDAPDYVIGFTGAQAGAGTLEFRDNLALVLLDQVLHCDGSLAREARPLSMIEEQLLRGALESLLAPYAALWSAYTPVQSRLQADPEPYQPNEPIYTAAYAVQTPHGGGTLTLVLRLPAWSEALATMTVPALNAANGKNLSMLDLIGDCTIVARAMLGSTRISITDLLSLRTGDIICLDQDADTPLAIHVNGRPKLSGQAHVENGQFVITVDTLLPAAPARA